MMMPKTRLISSSLNTPGRDQRRPLTGVGHPPGPYNGDFAQEILYHRLQVTVSPTLDFSYDYITGSGVLSAEGGTPIRDGDLDGYIQDLQAGVYNGYLDPLYNSHIAAPNIVAKRPCYIVIELFGVQNLTFQPSVAGITIAQYTKYKCMYHYDTSIDRSTPTAPPADDPCYLVCFGLHDFKANDLDDYSLIFQIAQASGNIIDAQVDPHIKNRG